STQKTNAIRLPVAALVNGETSYASEALAALLRDTGSGLIIGSRTAGRAMITKDFKLSNGDELRIATAPIQVGSAGALSSEGLKPDIEVSVSPEYERQYYADAFKVINAPAVASAEGAVTNQGEINATNQARRPIFNEAELVRERKQGIEGEQASAPPPPSEPQQPVVHDPALARAFDLLKGLAVVRHSGE
ncbi:MAG TPA: S41 family peptidase, partial [Verrucomicrobiae bacterium]|nr:S41 family peptidase [Verrucomicrobiae bacterium]